MISIHLLVCELQGRIFYTLDFSSTFSCAAHQPNFQKHFIYHIAFDLFCNNYCARNVRSGPAFDKNAAKNCNLFDVGNRHACSLQYAWIFLDPYPNVWDCCKYIPGCDSIRRHF